MWIDDIVLERCVDQTTQRIWVPDSVSVVCGNSNNPEREVDLKACEAAGVPVLKRYGGGGTVVLSPGCVIVSFGAWVKEPFHNDRYFKKINGAVCDALCEVGVLGAQQAGISDLVLGDRKFAGTSLFRSRNYLLYQASLIVDLEIDLIERYLLHPSREPEYRRGRSHSDFLCGLSEDHDLSVETVAAGLERCLESAIDQRLKGELVEPISEHVPNLLARIAHQT